MAGAVETLGMLPIRKCLTCATPFSPLRADHVFDTRGCQRRYRRYNDGPLPTEKNLANVWPALERHLYVRAIKSAKPPRTAIGYKLYSHELQIWLPLAGSVRYDGRRPHHDYFELRPVELPRVPLAAEYWVAWVYRGITVPSDPPYILRISMVSDMRRADEVGRRLKYWQAEQKRRQMEQGASAGQPAALNNAPKLDEDGEGSEDEGGEDLS